MRNHRFETRPALGQHEERLEALKASDDRQNQDQLELTQDHRDIDQKELTDAGAAIQTRRLAHAIRDIGQSRIIDQHIESADKGEPHHHDGEQHRARVAEPSARPLLQINRAKQLVEHAVL